MTSPDFTFPDSKTQLNIDPEFKALIPPLSTEERELLESSLKAEGCRDALVVWQGHNILIDGHNRYELCSKSNIPYTTIEREFESREDVIVWIARNQMARRNISDFTRGRLALKAEEAIKAKAKANQGARTDLLANLPKGSPIDTRKELASIAGVGERSIDKVRTIEANAPRAIVDKADKGELSIDRAFKITSALKNASPAIVETVVKNNVEDVDTINELKRVEKDAPDTFEEIVRSGHIQPSDPAKTVHIADGFKAVQTALRDKSKDHAVIATQARKQDKADIAFATGKYNVILADPPWRYEHVKTDNRAIENHYPTMELDDICKLPVQSITADDAILFMWATSPKLAEAMRVITEWGFVYRTCAIWDKEKIGMGYYFRQQHELLLVAAKGALPVPEPSNRVSSIFRSERGKHSEKPDISYKVIEDMYPEYPKVELFSRTVRAGWSGWGNEYNATAA